MYRGSKLEGPVNEYARRHGLALCAAALAFIGTYYSATEPIQGTADLEVDMKISQGRNLGVYVNDLTIQPRRLTIVPNIRRAYRFESIPAVITYLRIDPTDAPGAEISIYGAAIASEGKIVRTFGPAELKSWFLYNLKESPGDDKAFNLVNTRAADFLATPLSLIASPHPGPLLYIFNLLHSPNIFPVLVIVYFLLLLVCGLSTTQGAVEAGLVAVVASAAHYIAVLVSRLPGSPPAITAAVGNSGYTGYPKSTDYMVSFALLAFCLLLSLAASRYIAVQEPPSIPGPGVERLRIPGWASALVPAGVLICLLMLYIPNLTEMLKQLPEATFQSNNWDVQNFVLWEYLIQKGRLPFRDFWYPYSGFYTHLLAFPAGQLIAWAAESLSLWLVYLGLRFSLGRRRGAAVVLFLLILLPVWLNEFQGWYRYLFAIGLVLYYAALHDKHRIEFRLHVPFALFSGLVCFYEPTEFIYAGVGIFAHSMVAAWPGFHAMRDWTLVRGQVFPVVRQRVRIVLLPMIAGIVPALLVFAVQGMLPGFTRFQLSLTDASAYGSVAADVVKWTAPRVGIETVFMMPFFVLVVGLHGWFRRRQKVDAVGLAVLLLGMTGFMAMQKQITRPPILEQLQVFPYVGALCYGLAVWPRRTRAQEFVLASFVGFVIGVAAYRGGLASMYHAVTAAPSVFAGDYQVILHKGAEARSVNAGRYDPARFASYTSENAAVDVLKRDFEPGSHRTYVLGDESVFYILLGQDPPYVSNNYNCSPIAEQRHVLSWLRDRRPRFVIWNPAKDSYDGVPHAVRVPLIYQFIVENYRYVRTVGPYQILMDIRERGGTDPSSWRQSLGGSLDLGHIPALTESSAYGKCGGNSSASCRQVLLIHSAGNTAAGKAVVTLDSPLGPFRLLFDLAAGERDYIIDLDRLWFRSYVGRAPHATVSVFDAETRYEFRRRKDDVLY